MLFLLTDGQTRPNRLEGPKDKLYHCQFGRYCAVNANNGLQSQFLEKIKLNKDFYKGDQWRENEDLEAFLKDDTGQDRNRIKVIKNLIRPMVEQYRGNAIRMQFNARARSVSPKAINRREEKLAELMFYTDVAAQHPSFAGVLQKKLPIGKTKEETAQIFDNIYVDKYVEKINMLLKYVADLNKFSDKQVRVAEEMALSGLAVLEGMEYAGNQIFDVMKSEDFFFDRSAKDYDLGDAEYMGKMPYMLPTEIFEHYPSLKQDERKSIESYGTQWQKNISSEQYKNTGRIPVVHSYWRDCEKYEYGYVMDEYGYPMLTKINFTYEGEENPRYTDADLIDPKTERQKRVLGGKKKKSINVDVLRMCVFVPQEVLADATVPNQKVGDIVLDWGIVPYQETHNLDFSSVKFPFKCYCWGYIDGEILSPIDDAINPQRFINRVLSVAENQINNSRGSGTVYDKSAVDQADGENEMLQNMNQSKPVGVNARGRGIQNVIGSYDSTVKQGTMVMFNIVDVMKGHIQDVTGVNEALKGESTGSDQLVGVTQLLIQRGSLMQEPFYNAITQIFLQAYQSIATVGKRIYADNQRELAIITGDEGVEVLNISKDMKLEDFRVFVKRDNPDDILINAGNTMIMQMVQMGLLDRDRMANLYGRSTPDDVARALRQSAKEQKEVSRMQGQADEAQAGQIAAEAEKSKAEQMQMLDNMEAKEESKQMGKDQHDLDMVFAKSFGKMMEKGSEKTADLQNKVL